MNSKNRFFLFLGIIILLGFLSYILAISNTLSLREKYKAAKIDNNLTSNISAQLLILSKKQAYYDFVLSKLNLTNTSLENDLLRTLNTTSEKMGVKVKTFNKPHSFSLDGSEQITYDFTLEGKFIDLINLIYHLEKSETYGEIKHLGFNKQKDFRTRRTALTVDVLIQNIQ